jgi:hypothetical protein
MDVRYFCRQAPSGSKLARADLQGCREKVQIITWNLPVLISSASAESLRMRPVAQWQSQFAVMYI